MKNLIKLFLIFITLSQSLCDIGNNTSEVKNNENLNKYSNDPKRDDSIKTGMQTCFAKLSEPTEIKNQTFKLKNHHIDAELLIVSGDLFGLSKTEVNDFKINMNGENRTFGIKLDLFFPHIYSVNNYTGVERTSKPMKNVNGTLYITAGKNLIIFFLLNLIKCKKILI